MELTGKQYRRIAGLLPVQRGNVKIENRILLNALIYRCENGCTWWALPERFGKWHTVYMRLDRWSQNGVLERVYAALAAEGLADDQVYSLDSMAVKARPDAHGAGKKRPAGGREDPGRLEYEDTRAGNGRPADGGVQPGMPRTHGPGGCCWKPSGRWNGPSRC